MKINHKIFWFFLFIFSCCFLLTGCHDAIEIDEEVYTLAIGVDKGINNVIRVTVQYATYKEGGGAQGGGGSQGGGGDEESAEETGEVDGTIVSTVEAPSLLEGINILNLSSNRQISLFHTKMLVFSEDYAREGVMRYVEPLVRYREVRETMRVIVCKGLAGDFIKENKGVVGDNTAKTMELGFYQSENTGYFPDTFFHDFYTDILSPYGQPTAIYAGVNSFDQIAEPVKGQNELHIQVETEPGGIPRIGGSKSEFYGTAVFDGDKMVGYLLQNETRFYLMSIGKFSWGVFTLEDKNSPGDVYVLEVIVRKEPEIQVRFQEGIPVIDLKLELGADIISIQSRIDYENLERIHELEVDAEKYFCEGIKKTIRKTKEEWNSDIFHFGKKAAGNFRTIQEMESYNWLKHYQEAEVSVEVDVKLRRTGFLFETEPIRRNSSNMEGQE